MCSTPPVAAAAVPPTPGGAVAGATNAPAGGPDKAVDLPKQEDPKAPTSSTTPTKDAVDGTKGGAIAGALGGPAQLPGNEEILKILTELITLLTDLIAKLGAKPPVQQGGATAGASGSGPAKGDDPKQGGPVQQTPPPVVDLPKGAVGGATSDEPKQGGPVQQVPTQVEPPKGAIAGATSGPVKAEEPKGGPVQQVPTPVQQVPTQVEPPKGAIAGASSEPVKAEEPKGGPVQQVPTPVQQVPTQVEPPKGAIAGATSEPVKVDTPAQGGPVQQVPTPVQQVPTPVQQVPVVTPPKVEPPKGAIAGATSEPVKVDTPAQGGPVQQTPVQQVPPKGGPVEVTGDVTLSNVDKRYSAKLESGKNSVELWGDPHVVIALDGKTEKFDIGYGPGEAKLSDGATIRWETFPPGHDKQYILSKFTVDTAGTTLDRTVATTDGKDEASLSTGLNATQMREFAAILRTYEGPMSKPLTLVTPKPAAA